MVSMLYPVFTNRLLQDLSSAANQILMLLVALMLFGCDSSREKPPTKAPLVTVASVEQRQIEDNREYVATTESIQSVELIARVEGFLIERKFEEGSDVNKGDLLYQIDPATYKAALKQAKGGLADNRAALADAKAELVRQRQLVEKGFISRQAFDDYQASVKEYEGKVTASIAAVEQAQLNLGYCSVYAPFSGRIGYTRVNVGNLVGPDKNPKLAELVRLDPIYADFRPRQDDLLMIQQKQMQQPVAVSLSLDQGTRFPHPGTIQTIDNRVDPETGTIRVRAVFPNPEKTLVPGEYVRVQVHLGYGVGLLVPRSAVVETQGGFQVFVVSEDQTVTATSVGAGRLIDGDRVITSGVTAGQRVVTSGVQKLESGMRVREQALPEAEKPAAEKPDRAKIAPPTEH